MGRQALLSVVSAALSMHDPSVAKGVIFAPERASKDINFGQYVRIEESLNSKYLHDIALIRGVNNEKINKSKFSFSYQPHEEPKLIILRKEYKLDEVAASAKTEFEAMILLRNWTRSQFRRGDYQPFMRYFDALQVLRNNFRNRNNEPHKFGLEFRPCHFFPLFYAQVLLSMGYQPRLVRISPLEDKGYDGHGMTEVWSNQFRKWIAMDPDLNIHYEKGGVPLNLLEVHNERYVTRPSTIRIIQGIHTAGDFDPSKQVDIRDMIQLHGYIQILDMRNDWLTNHYFRGHPARSDRATLFWRDERQPAVFHFKPETNRIEDFYWTLNQTEIWVRDEKGTDGKIHLNFNTFTPNFRNFEILINRAKKIETPDPHFEWQLQPGLNRLEVRSVNQYGVPGIESWIEIEKR